MATTKDRHISEGWSVSDFIKGSLENWFCRISLFEVLALDLEKCKHSGVYAAFCKIQR